MKAFLFYLALSCWLCALTIHILSLSGIDVLQTVPFIYALHIGIFVLWLPIMLNLRKNPEYLAYRQAGIRARINPVAAYRIIFKESPAWIIVIALGGFAYAFINFILFLSYQEGVTAISNKQYILQNHGQLIRTLTEKEYHQYRADEIRGFSGHWIAFYGMAVAIFFPFALRTHKAIE